MTITLGADLEKIVQEKVSNGGYNSPGDVLSAALRLLEAQDAEKLDALKRDIDNTTSQFDNGGYTTYSSASELVNEIKSEGRQRYNERKLKSA